MSFSYGLHVKYEYNLPATLSCPELDQVYQKVGQAGEGRQSLLRELLNMRFAGCERATHPSFPWALQSFTW
jgi:hypothetical protein